LYFLTAVSPLTVDIFSSMIWGPSDVSGLKNFSLDQEEIPVFLVLTVFLVSVFVIHFTDQLATLVTI
jgi:hypothetical protein